jgi:diguanylate cyclase (GGDEF)-like protein
LNNRNTELIALSIKDQLTSLYNRAHFNDTLSIFVAHATRHAGDLSLIILDIDHFKRVNHTIGHLVGDAVLRELAVLIMNHCRKSDIIFRYGGEEIALILPGTNNERARLAAEKIRLAVESHSFLNITWPITVSLGVSSFDPGDTEENLIQRSDSQLYIAKNNGRNRTEG